MTKALTLSYEPRPRDFAARLRRRGVAPLGLRRARRHLGRRALMLLAAIGVPALAAPQGWQSLALRDAAGGNGLLLDPMPFERPGESFPGSAFYYVAQSEQIPTGLDPNGLPTDASGAALVDFTGGPVARAMRIDNSGVDRSRALECLTAAIYYEAASEPDQGQRAVAQVILNRVAHPAFPRTVCGVVYQGSERSTGCQFSFTCDGSLARRPSAYFWARAQRVAAAALAGYVEPSVGLATHYHTVAVHPRWDADMNHVTTIGAHMFFRWRGRAGDANQFRFAYSGGEPVAAPHPHSAAADAQGDAALDPLALQRSYEAGLGAAHAAQPGEPAPAPGRASQSPDYSAEQRERGGDRQYSGENLPTAQGVRPEYQGSGQWIAQPAG